jgi:hypothetical protein
MTLAQIKQIVLSHMPQAEVQEYGDLRLKATWEAALAKCQEFIAVAAEEVIETAELLLEHGAIAVQDWLAETLTYDNAVNLAFSTTAIAQKTFWFTLKAVFVVSCCFYYLGQEFGKDFYRVRLAAHDLELEDLARPIAKPNFETLTVKELKALCTAHSREFKPKSTKSHLIQLLTA